MDYIVGDDVHFYHGISSRVILKGLDGLLVLRCNSTQELSLAVPNGSHGLKFLEIPEGLKELILGELL